MRLFYKNTLIIINFLLYSNTIFALESLSYSGRLVQTSGQPVTGPVTIRAELAYTNALANILCTEDILNVTLTKGVFHIKLDLDCSASGLTLTQVLSQVPNGESVAIRITDITNISSPISYNFQALHAIPFANVASQLVQMGATNDQVLKWNNTTKKWEPGTPGGGGTVTTVSGTLPISVANGSSTPVVSISQANSTTNGYLSSTDWNTFNNKQNALPGGGNTSHYLRGDSSWQTLNTDAVTEGTKLYFENARVLLAPLTGFLPSSSAIVDTDTVLSAFNKTQGQINTINTNAAHFLLKDSADTLSSNVTLSGSISSTLTGDIIVRDTPLGLTSAVNKGYVDSGDALKVNKSGDTISGVLTLDDDLKIKATGAGTNYVTLRANSAAANYNLVLPTSAGSTGQFLQTDGSGNLSWVAQSSSATPSGAAGGDLAGTYPNPTLKTGVVTDTHIATTLSQSKITNLTTDLASKQSSTLSSGNILVGNGSNVATAVAVSGDATLNNTGVLTLSNSGVTAGTYNSVTVDGKGRVTGGTLGTTISSLGVTAPITNTGTASDPVLAIDQASTTNNGYLSSTDWNTFNNKQATISKATTQDVSKLRIYGANATNYVELSAATLTGNRSLIFPDSNGSSGNVLSTDGAGNLSWTSLSTAAPVTSVNTLAGAVTLTTTNIAEGTNQYHTGARVLATPITAPTLTNASIATSDTVQVAFGKLQAQFNNILSLALDGLSTATNAAITASDTIISAFGKLQKQITDLTGDVTTLSASNSNKLNKNTADSITATITVSGAGDILVPSTPAGMTSAVNKTYVDDRIANANNQWGTDGTNVYRSTGNVGIGTTSPSAKLDVGGNIAINGTLYNPAEANDGFVGIASDSAAGTATSGVRAWGRSNLSYPGDLHLISRDTGAIRFYNYNGSTWNEQARVSSTGNVGIGTTIPSEKLDIIGGRIKVETDDSYIHFYDTAGSNVDTRKAYVGVWNNRFIVQGRNDALTSTGDLFNINLANGNTGVGTASPQAKLHIASPGATNAVALQIDSQGTYKRDILMSEFGTTAYGGIIRYDSGADVLQLLTLENSVEKNGISIARVTGNVGIGTTAPASPLDVVGAIRASSSMNAINFGINAAGTAPANGMFAPAGNTLALSTATAERLRIDSAGNVGIGTSSPSQKLVISNGALLLDNNNSINWKTSSGSDRAMIYLRNDDVLRLGNTGLGDGSNAITFHVEGVTDAMFINSSGVGIGTTTPDYKLHLAQGNTGAVTEYGAKFETSEVSSTDFGIIIKGARNGTLKSDVSFIDFSNFDDNEGTGTEYVTSRISGGMHDASGMTGVMQFSTNDGTGLKKRMIIDKAGNVGIGTTSPSYKLQVGIAADGSEARANSWNTLSDERLKKNFLKVQDSLEKIQSLNAYYYNWNRGTDTSRKIGLKAQEVKKVFPELVSLGKDGYLSVSYDHLVAVAIEAIKKTTKKLKRINSRLLKVESFTSQNIKEVNLLKSENKELKVRIDRATLRIVKAEKEYMIIKHYICSKDPKAIVCRN